MPPHHRHHPPISSEHEYDLVGVSEKADMDDVMGGGSTFSQLEHADDSLEAYATAADSFPDLTYKVKGWWFGVCVFRRRLAFPFHSCVCAYFRFCWVCCPRVVSESFSSSLRFSQSSFFLRSPFIFL
jgi:hypothetical protein